MKRNFSCFLVLCVCLSFFSISSRASEKQATFSIGPREFAVFQIGHHEVVPFDTYQYQLSDNVQKAVTVSPPWLQKEVLKTFQNLDRRPIQLSEKTKPAFGDINNDHFDDIVLMTSAGEIILYMEQGFPYQSVWEKTISIPLDFPDDFLADKDSSSRIFSPALYDINEDGYTDLFFGYMDQIYVCENQSDPSAISFAPPSLIFQPTPEETDPEEPIENPEEEEEEIVEAYSPFVFTMNDSPCMVVGKADGTLFLLRLEEQKDHSFAWIEKPSYFANWNEQWEENPDKKGVAVQSYASPCVFPFENSHPNLRLMCIGSSSGNFSFFYIHTNSMLPQIQTIDKMPSFDSPQWTAPAFEDINRDGRIDFVFGAIDGKLYSILNYGDPIHISWNPLESKAEMNNLTHFFGGIGFHRAYDPLYCVGNHKDLIEDVSSFILEVHETNSPYLDEVVYCLANFQTTDIIQYFQEDLQSILVENAKGIYEMAQQVQYCSILEEEGYTTLQYKTRISSDEETEDTLIDKTLPKEVYYKYLVMINRYLLVPTRWESFYQKNFYRTYLPHDTTYVHEEEEEKSTERPSAVTLFDRVKNAETMYDAAWNIMFWLKDDIGGVWHTGEKPPGWFNIYHNLLNTDVGIWCGEWSIIYEACARAMNIPTIIIIGLGEDHQYNNFYDNGWHHVDPSAGESGNTGTWEPYIGNSLIYYEKWGKRIFSWPMEWEGNGKYDHVWRSELPYNPPEKLSNLSFVVTDIHNNPVEGARIELWSHWPMENKYVPVPFPSAFGYTDSTGQSAIQKVGHQNFTCVVTSRIGTTSFYIPLRDVDNVPELEYSVILSGEIPVLYDYYDAFEPNYVFDQIQPIRIPVSEEDPEPWFNEENNNSYVPIKILEKANCSVSIENNTATIQTEN
ncbi:MAG: transglutaminase-like domain-containing protein, partial [Caldisericia bacterium]|nr:transglutaminase-like domain-containing protein [Caldisericia bacterium]